MNVNQFKCLLARLLEAGKKRSGERRATPLAAGSLVTHVSRLAATVAVTVVVVTVVRSAL